MTKSASEMDTISDHSTRATEDVIVCYLEEAEKWRNRFPKAELCFVGCVFVGFLVITGGVMVFLHYWLEARDDFHSVTEHMNVAMHVVGLTFFVVAGLIMTSLLCACVVAKVMSVLDMAHKYREHRELCAYEELRRSVRSQQSGFSRSCDAVKSLGTDVT